jgi:hypothetical protein
MHDYELCQQLTRLLTVRQAHMDFEDAVADFPADQINTRLPGCAYTVWQLLEHMRICQRNILGYIQSDSCVWLTFPADLWPDPAATTDEAGWQQTISHFLADRQALAPIINDPESDLFAPLPHSGAQQHSILREIHIIASHNAYHTGELAIVRGMLGLWPAG